MRPAPRHYSWFMAPEKNRKALNEAVEGAHDRKQLGSAPQSKVPRRRLDAVAEGPASASQHHLDDDNLFRAGEPPREDRAG